MSALLNRRPIITQTPDPAAAYEAIVREVEDATEELQG